MTKPKVVINEIGAIYSSRRTLRWLPKSKRMQQYVDGKWFTVQPVQGSIGAK